MVLFWGADGSRPGVASVLGRTVCCSLTVHRCPPLFFLFVTGGGGLVTLDVIVEGKLPTVDGDWTQPLGGPFYVSV